MRSEAKKKSGGGTPTDVRSNNGLGIDGCYTCVLLCVHLHMTPNTETLMCWMQMCNAEANSPAPATALCSEILPDVSCWTWLLACSAKGADLDPAAAEVNDTMQKVLHDTYANKHTWHTHDWLNMWWTCHSTTSAAIQQVLNVPMTVQQEFFIVSDFGNHHSQHHMAHWPDGWMRGTFTAAARMSPKPSVVLSSTEGILPADVMRHTYPWSSAHEELK